MGENISPLTRGKIDIPLVLCEGIHQNCHIKIIKNNFDRFLIININRILIVIYQCIKINKCPILLLEPDTYKLTRGGADAIIVSNFLPHNAYGHQ